MKITLKTLRNEYQTYYKDDMSPREYAEYCDLEYFYSELLDEELTIITDGVK